MLLTAALLGLLFSIPLRAIAEPETNTKPYDILPVAQAKTATSTETSTASSSPAKAAPQKERTDRKTYSGTKEGTLITSPQRVSTETLRQYLGKSPLADYSEQILESPYWATIIGICTIEQYGCQRAPYFSPYNYWGLMSRGQLIKFKSQEEAIDYIHNFLDKAYNNGRTTVESFRGWYCASACTNWESTVLKTKLKLEALNETQNLATQNPAENTLLRME